MTTSSYLIDAESLHAQLGEKGWRIIDCRFDLADPGAGEQQYLQGHIPGAVFADLDRDLSAPTGPQTGRHPMPEAALFERFVGELGIDNSTHIVVYDGGNGALAARAWWLLRWAGHSSVQLLDGGMDGWLERAYPLGSGAEHVEVERFIARPQPGMVLGTDEVAGSPDSSLRLVDARDAERFRGEHEPIDPVAGHVPGAINVPLTRSLNPDGSWKPRRELVSLWQDVLGEDREAPWAVMCGSGVTACHLALSAMEAGYAEPRVYVGSWSEWIRDPARPVALGPA